MDIKHWLEFAKAQREMWHRTGSRDMPPYVVGERNGQTNVMIMPPQIDKQLAFRAAALLRQAFASDAITMVIDGFGIDHDMGVKDGMKLYEEIREKYDTLQKAFEEGVEGVVEHVTVFNHSLNGKVSLANAQYRITDGKLVWGYEQTMEDNKDARVEGTIPETISKIMSRPTVLEMEDVQKMAGKLGLSDDREKQVYHASRAARKLLQQEDFVVLECVPWNPREGRGVLLEKLMKKYDEVKGVYDFDEMKSKIPKPSMN